MLLLLQACSNKQKYLRILQTFRKRLFRLDLTYTVSRRLNHLSQFWLWVRVNQVARSLRSGTMRGESVSERRPVPGGFQDGVEVVMNSNGLILLGS